MSSSCRLLAPSLALTLAVAANASSLPSLSAASPAAAASSEAATARPRAESLGDFVLVLPFAAVESQEPEWLSAGIAEFMSESLATVGQSLVDDDERIEVLEDSGLAREPRLTLASACLLGRDAGARRVVTGAWTATDATLTVTARSVDVRRMKLVEEASSKGTIEGLGPVLAHLALEIFPAGKDAKAEIERLGATPSGALLPWLQAAAEPDMAPQHLEAALQVKPDFAPAILALAAARLDAGQPEQVATLVSRVPATAPVHHQAQAKLLAGRAHVALGETPAALTALKESVRLRPGRTALLWLAEAQLAAHDPQGAAVSARRVLELLPGDEHALSVLERLSEEPTPTTPPAAGGRG